MISNVAATKIGQSTAGISWTSASTPPAGEYRTTTAYGSFSAPGITYNYDSHSDPVGLTPGRLYHSG
jgi:hypothetical protein